MSAVVIGQVITGLVALFAAVLTFMQSRQTASAQMRASYLEATQTAQAALIDTLQEERRELQTQLMNCQKDCAIARENYRDADDKLFHMKVDLRVAQQTIKDLQETIRKMPKREADDR